MEILLPTILSILCLIQFVVIIYLYNNINSIKRDNKKLKSDIDLVTKIVPGDKVTEEVCLTWGGKHSFSVIYELSVVDVSDKQLKVCAYDFSIISKLPDPVLKDPNHRKDIIDFYQNKWVNKSDVSLIVGKQAVRDKRIDQLIS